MFSNVKASNLEFIGTSRSGLELIKGDRSTQGGVGRVCLSHTLHAPSIGSPAWGNPLSIRYGTPPETVCRHIIAGLI